MVKALSNTKMLFAWAVAAVVLSAACAGNGQKGYQYPQEVVTDQVSRCTAALSGQVSAEVAQSRCRCTIDKIQEQFSLATFQDLAELNRLTGELPRSLQPITEECRR